MLIGQFFCLMFIDIKDAQFIEWSYGSDWYLTSSLNIQTKLMATQILNVKDVLLLCNVINFFIN